MNLNKIIPKKYELYLWYKIILIRAIYNLDDDEIKSLYLSNNLKAVLYEDKKEK